MIANGNGNVNASVPFLAFPGNNSVLLLNCQTGKKWDTRKAEKREHQSSRTWLPVSPPFCNCFLQCPLSAPCLVPVCTQSQVSQLQCFLNVRPNVCQTGPVNIAQCLFKLGSPIFSVWDICTRTRSQEERQASRYSGERGKKTTQSIHRFVFVQKASWFDSYLTFFSHEGGARASRVAHRRQDSAALKLHRPVKYMNSIGLHDRPFA